MTREEFCKLQDDVHTLKSKIRDLQRAIKLRPNEGGTADPVEGKIRDVLKRIPQGNSFAAVYHVMTEVFSKEEVLCVRKTVKFKDEGEAKF